MRLPRDGQEYAHITFTNIPFNVPIEISVDNRTTWNATTAGGSANERLILLRGPNSTRTEGLLVDRNTSLWVRIADNPETVVREAGLINLY